MEGGKWGEIKPSMYALSYSSCKVIEESQANGHSHGENQVHSGCTISSTDPVSLKSAMACILIHHHELRLY